ncbi:major allergen pru ar 1 [Quercus suber]|uniref:Major allergen pru ar 1 n=1 Tax=Quercus suber TaxID=58331 RepID=A0AAW0LPL9_QUESU
MPGNKSFEGIFKLYGHHGVFTYENEITSAIPPARLFKAFVLDADNLIPKLAPMPLRVLKSLKEMGARNHQEDHLWRSQFKYVKHRIDEIDQANFTYCYSVIEDCASPDGGSVLKNTSKYHTKGEQEIKEEKVMAGKEKAAGLFKAVEAYLLAHPDAYN